MIYEMPALTASDEAVIAEIHSMRTELAHTLRTPRRWQGGLRRTTQARAVQGSSSIEGYVVSDADAAAAVDGDEPLTADERTWAEILGYRRMLTFVLQMAQSPGFRADEQTLRAMHFMLLEHELAKSPGQWRTSEIYIHRDESQERVYQGPDPEMVPELVAELVHELGVTQGDVLVRAAMAHLNLVMIHPFRDGNGRMARALQTLVLGQGGLLEPTFASIEEWLGHNTPGYYDVLARTGQGRWSPENDATTWVRFCLRGHHMQAQTHQRRFTESNLSLALIDALVTPRGLPERTVDALLDAALGVRLRRPGYVERVGVDERTASRDLARLTETGLLTAHGATRGRYYLTGPVLADALRPVRENRAPLRDPYPEL